MTTIPRLVETPVAAERLTTQSAPLSYLRSPRHYRSDRNAPPESLVTRQIAVLQICGARPPSESETN